MIKISLSLYSQNLRKVERRIKFLEMKKIISIIVIALCLGYSNVVGQPGDQQFDSLQVLINRAQGQKQVDLINQQAKILQAKQADLRIEISKKALESATKLKYTTGQVVACNNIGVGYYMKYQIDSSLIFLEQGYKLVKRLGDKRLEAELLTNLGNTYERLVEFRKANEYHFEALEIRQNLRDSAGISLSLNNIGLNYWRVGEYVASEGYFNRSLEIRRNLGDIQGMGKVLNNLGVLHWNWGHYFKALTTYLESLNAREKTKDTIGIVVTMNNLAILYQKLGDREKALDYLERSLATSKKTKYNFGIAYSYENLGNYYKAIHDYDKALDYFQLSAENYALINFIAGITDLKNALGEVYYDKGEYIKAKEYFIVALSQSRVIENKKALIFSLSNLGKVNVRLNQINAAKEYLDEAMKLLEGEKIADYLRDVNFNYAMLYEKRGDLRTAYGYLKSYKVLSDSLFNLENSRVINDLKEKYDAEKKEKENELLRSKTELQELELKRQNYILNLFGIALLFIVVFSASLYYAYLTKKKAKEKVDSLYEDLKLINKQLSESEKNLRELNKTKDKLFSIIAHDLKNPFLALSGYSELLYEGYNDYPDEDKIQMIKDIKEVSNNTYQLLENLLGWARIQTGKMGFTREKINLSELIKENITLIQPSIKLKDQVLLSNIEEGIELKADKEMINTVIRNMLSNGVKFTDKGGEIQISAETINGNVHLIFADTGVGIEKADIETLMKSSEFLSTNGTEGEKGSGLGLVLCNEFVQIHRGKISIESEVGKGSKFTVTLPVD